MNSEKIASDLHAMAMNTEMERHKVNDAVMRTDARSSAYAIGHRDARHAIADAISAYLASVPPGASPGPAWIPGKYGYDRKGGCGCSWASDRHGDLCPEHGNPALSAPETPAAPPTETLLKEEAAAQAEDDAEAIEDMRLRNWRAENQRIADQIAKGIEP